MHYAYAAQLPNVLSLVSVMQHALEKIPSACMRIMLPHPPEPKDDLTTFLDSLGNTSVLRMPVMPAVSSATLSSTHRPLDVLPTGGSGMEQVPPTSVPVFGGVPITPVPTGMAMGISLFKSSIAPPPNFTPLQASRGLASSSLAPAAASTPKASGSAIGLPVSIPLTAHLGGRSDSLTDPIQVGSHVIAGSLVGMGEEGNAVLNDKLRRMTGDVTQKHGIQLRGKRAHDNDSDEEDEGDDADGSTFEDLEEAVTAPVKKAGKAKSPAKSAPTTDKWTMADLDRMRQNRYGLDRADKIA